MTYYRPSRRKATVGHSDCCERRSGRRDNADDMRLVLTHAETLAKAEARTLGDTLGNVKGKALVNTLTEAEAATSAITLGYVKMRKLPISWLTRYLRQSLRRFATYCAISRPGRSSTSWLIVLSEAKAAKRCHILGEVEVLTLVDTVAG